MKNLAMVIFFVCGILCIAVLTDSNGEMRLEGMRVDKNNSNDLTPFMGWGFTIDISGHIQGSKKSPVEDFELYTFSDKQGKRILQAYAGNHPEFPRNHEKNIKAENIKIGDLKAKTIDWTNSQGKYRETLVELPRKKGAPLFVHFWYEGLSPSDSSIADRIISSIKPST